MDSSNLNPHDYHSRKKGRAHTGSLECPVLFFDIVGFSKEMDNEKAKTVVGSMHNVMWEVLDNDKFFWAEEKRSNASKNNLVVIPTGDGYGIATDTTLAGDEILWIARKLARALRKTGITIRMGIARGRNVVTIDLNETVNVFGYGIVVASRVCNVASPGQILVHSGFASSLLEDKAIPELKLIPVPFKAKHGFTFSCHNYFRRGEFGKQI